MSLGKSQIGQLNLFIDILNHVNLKEYLMHYYFYYLNQNSINEQCETHVSSPLHFIGLPDFLSNSDCVIFPTGNGTTPVTEQACRVHCKK